MERALFCSDRYNSPQNIHLLLRRLTQLLAESLIDKAIEVRFIGGVYSNQRPTEFLCLLLKLLQIQPEKEILVEYLRAEEFKYPFSSFIMDYIDSFFYRYLRALAALYIRMTFRAVDVYELLEPLLKDYRKLRSRNMCKHVVDTLESCFDFPL